MKNLISELKKRGVTRVAGFYVAVVWLSLQLAEILFPAFDIPDSALRIILYTAIAGFPCALLFAWFYEITDQGIQREEDLQESGAERRKSSGLMYGATIGALVLALGTSLFVNFRQAEDAPVVTPDNISVLIADIDNQTLDPIFDGSLEQALAIGLEGASFINSFARHQALKIADQISSGEQLDEDRARLVSVREGIVLVLAGSIEPDADGFEMRLRAVDPQTGEMIAEAESGASSKSDVLVAVAELAAQIREALGDVTLEDGHLSDSESFSAASLDAVQHYTQAQSLAQIGKDEEAIPLYEKAIVEDPNFGRAYSGWALSESNLGHTEKSGELWEKTLALLDGMTQREQYRTLGLYYNLVTRNYNKAIENYELLVKHYPADAVGRNNLAVTYFYNRQFEEALKEGKLILDMYPGNPTFLSNYALYAMYASDFATAREQSMKLLAMETSYYKALLPLAMAELAEGNTEAAKQAYRDMSSSGDRAASLSVTGLADIALYQGSYLEAVELLQAGIAEDAKLANKVGQANKLVMLAEARFHLGLLEEATEAVNQAITLSRGWAQLIAASRLYLFLGETTQARAIQEELAGALQMQARAAAGLLKGGIHLAEGNIVASFDALQTSLERSDSWLGHFLLGRAYFSAGHYAEALSEFELCEQRLGEATSIFLDDTPTFRYSAPLNYWLGSTKAELGMVAEATANLNSYLEIQNSSIEAPLKADARKRLNQIQNL